MTVYEREEWKSHISLFFSSGCWIDWLFVLTAGRVHHQRGKPAARCHRPHQSDLCVRADRQGWKYSLLPPCERGSVAAECSAQPDHTGEESIYYTALVTKMTTAVLLKCATNFLMHTLKYIFLFYIVIVYIVCVFYVCSTGHCGESVCDRWGEGSHLLWLSVCPWGLKKYSNMLN